jgi:hypothetical protein
MCGVSSIHLQKETLFLKVYRRAPQLSDETTSLQHSAGLTAG